MRSLLAIATDLRAEAPCIAGGLSAPCSDCSLMIEAAEALEKINAHHGVKLRRESQLEAQIEVLELTIGRLRCVCDAAFTVVREDGDEDGWTAWQELVSALEDARYDPAGVYGSVPDHDRQDILAMIDRGDFAP